MKSGVLLLLVLFIGLSVVDSTRIKGKAKKTED